MTTGKPARDGHVFEIMLILLVLGMTVLLHLMGAHKVVILNLFYLPIVLSGYYLGRYSAGVLAMLSVLCVTIVCMLDATGFAAYTSPAMMGLVLTVWAAVLGLSALLVGTLCDERASTVEELHEAYVGVVEVVSRYLKGVEGTVKTSCVRVAELSQSVATAMGLALNEIDDIRVGVLLHDLGDVEVTTKLLHKAVDAIEAHPTKAIRHTFLGTDLVRSLGSVLTRAASLILSQDETIRECLAGAGESRPGDIPIGAKIIRAVRAYDALTASGSGEAKMSPAAALRELREDTLGGYDHDVLDAMESLVQRPVPAPAHEHALT